MCDPAPGRIRSIASQKAISYTFCNPRQFHLASFFQPRLEKENYAYKSISHSLTLRNNNKNKQKCKLHASTAYYTYYTQRSVHYLAQLVMYIYHIDIYTNTGIYRVEKIQQVHLLDSTPHWDAPHVYYNKGAASREWLSNSWTSAVSLTGEITASPSISVYCIKFWSNWAIQLNKI